MYFSIVFEIDQPARHPGRLWLEAAAWPQARTSRFTEQQSDLTDQDAFNLDAWIKNYPVLGEAYRLKEAFYAVYEESTNKEDALARYEAWSKSVPVEIRPYFSDLIRAYTNWQPRILNYFDQNVTNTYTECLNSLIRVADRMGRGYIFEALR